MAKIQIANVEKTFPATGSAGETRALGPIDLNVQDGEIVAITGPSGCGKSTLLRMIGGLDNPTTGAISINGALTNGPSPDCGMVFQQPGLFPWLTIAGNIEFGLKGRADTAGQGKADIASLIAMVGLDGFENHYPATLSGGMQQRAALARSLASAPDTLLLDEPFGALDQQTRGLMQELLLDIWAERSRTMVLVTHDVEEAIFLADRVVVLSNRPGQVVADLAIDLDRPRHYTMKTEAGFSKYRAEISEILRGELVGSG